MSQKEESPIWVILRTLKSYSKEIVKRSWIVAIMAILLLLFGFKRYQTNKVDHFQGAASFMLEQAGGGSGGTIGGILGGLGLVSGGGEQVSEDKLIDLMRTRRILGNALWAKVEMDGKEDFLINHFIRVEDLPNTIWKGNSKMQDFRFEHDKLGTFTEFENQIFKSIVSRMANLHVVGSITKTRIMVLRTSSKSQDFIVKFVPQLLSSLETFYVSKSVEGQQVAFEQLGKRKDSIERALNGAEYSLAKWEDANIGLIKRKGNTNQGRLIRKITILQAMYEESVKNVELAKMNLLTETPVIQVIDLPIAPLNRIRTKMISFLIPFLIIGTFLGIMLVVVRKFLVDELKK